MREIPGASERQDMMLASFHLQNKCLRCYLPHFMKEGAEAQRDHTSSEEKGQGRSLQPSRVTGALCGTGS